MRAPLAQRVRTFLPADAEDSFPAEFIEGKSSFLRSLLQCGRLAPRDLQRFLSQETGHPILQSLIGPGTPPLQLPDGFLEEREILAVGRAGDPIYGMVWPHDIPVIDELAFRLGSDFPRAILCRDELAGGEAPEPPQEEHTVVETLLGRLREDDPRVEVVDSYDLLEDLSTSADEAPIIKLLNLIIVQGCRDLASDIHLEPEESVSRVRYRIDGLLKEVMLPPKRFHNALVSRIKIMSDLDIAEKRSPQDGRMKLRLGEKHVDVRVSTIPSVFGEKVVLRILREESILMDITELGFAREQAEQYCALARRPYGIILVTGPTGSGKTTTLYSTLNFLNAKSKNIVTIEDPVEFQMENINQIQVNRRAGIDFASGLKSILRQDPDIIMIGEMRDEETAAIAVKAALTGHLVLSTLHTNDAPGAYGRLQDMKVAPYLLASAIVGVVAQRLVRMTCPDCKVRDHPDAESLAVIGLNPEDGVELYRGAGCTRCGGTGYRGRRGVYEMLTPTREVKKLILTGHLDEGVEVPGFRRMEDHARDQVLSGVTSVEEVCRVVRV